MKQNCQKSQKIDFPQSHDEAFWGEFLSPKWSFLSKEHIFSQFWPEKHFLKDPLGFESTDNTKGENHALDQAPRWANGAPEATSVAFVGTTMLLDSTKFSQKSIFPFRIQMEGFSTNLHF